VARSLGSRSCGAPVIARRKFVWRQRDSIEGAFIVLKKKKGCTHVRELYGSKREEGVRIRGQEVAGAYCRSTTIPFTSGGAAGSGSGGLAAMARVLGREGQMRTGGGGGVYIGAVSWARGKRLHRNRIEIRRGFPGARRVHPGLWQG
jgi:hypothetical protein